MRLKFLLLLFLLGFILKPIKSSAQVNVQDSLALVDLYDSTGGVNWTNHTSWLNGPVSSWSGVTVAFSRVTILNLSSNNLIGTLPNSITNLTGLGSTYGTIGLNLSNNSLIGRIPPGLFALHTYEINLSNNQLSGLIPAFSRNIYLSILDISHNKLSGSIPSSLNENNVLLLEELNLSSNDLSGLIPDSLGFEQSLFYLNLSNNQLSGFVPITLSGHDSLKTFPVSGTSFLLDSNQLTFSGMEPLAAYYNGSTQPPKFLYSSQASVRINMQDNKLSVSAGGTLSNNTYKWYNGNTLMATITGDSTFVPEVAGNYSVAVINSIATQLTLYSDTISANSITVQGCSGSNDTLISNLSGANYQWQVNDGTGFANTNLYAYNFRIYLYNIQSTFNGYQYRCIVDGDTSNVYIIQITDTWTGAESNAWENYGNWSCGEIPDSNTDVFINSGTPPVILSSNQSVRSITVSPSASFTIISPYNLTVTH